MSRLTVLVTVVALAAIAFALEHNTLSQHAKQLSGEQLVNYVNAQGKWKAQVYERFADKTDEELKFFLGAAPPQHRRPHKPRTGRKDFSRGLEVPDSFNAVEAWPECNDIIGLVHDQSRCGSCWAVSTASALSDRLCIATKGEVQKSLSAFDILQCCAFCSYHVCTNGGYPDYAMDHFVDYGVVTGTNYTAHGGCKPYHVAPCEIDPVSGNRTCPEIPQDYYSCQTKCADGYVEESYNNDHYYGDETYNYQRENKAVIADLVSNGPLVVSFQVFRDFMSYSSGVYEHLSGESLGWHAVRLIGYGNENGTDYWLAANSWNTTWGDGGYFKVKRGNNEVNFETEVNTATIDVERSLKDK